MRTRTRVGLHRFASDASLPQRDGVNLAHLEINELLQGRIAPDIEVTFHDFDRLLRDEAHARETLAGLDCVLCNVGPHAHYYHFLRERLGLDFRIVRDIRTALWSCYLLQESLCEPYLRPGDTLLALSQYSRALTRHLFPHLGESDIHVFDPVLARAARSAPVTAQQLQHGVITLGHIGRLSEDKNFPQMVDLLVALDREEPWRYRLVACGAVHSPSCEPQRVADRIRRETGREGLFTYIPPLPHAEVMRLFRSFDWFLFFSTSNLETLGRVLVEAAHAAVPVLAADHAACGELLHGSSLLDVAYSAEPFYSHFDAPMGRVDIAQAAERIRLGTVPAPPPETRVNDLAVLLAVLRGETQVSPASAHAGTAEFLQRLRWEGLQRFARKSDAEPVMRELHDWFCALNGRSSGAFESRLAQLKRRSRFPERTERFLAAARSTLCDFSNLGGFDMELCNVVGYHPRFQLQDVQGADAQTSSARAPGRP